MLNFIWTHLVYGRRFYGVEHHNDVLYGTILIQTKKELNIAASVKEKSIEALSKYWPKNQHLALIVNNDKVLSKTIENNTTDVFKLVHKAFPNVNLTEFYYEVFSQKKIHHINICRKDYINSLIETYASHKLYVIHLSLGNHSISVSAKYVLEKEIYSTNAKINIENNQVLDIKKTTVYDTNYNINGLIVNNNQLLSFSGALQCVTRTSLTKINFLNKQKSWVSTYKQTRFFYTFLKFGGLFILGVLLLNFLIYNHYFETVNTLEEMSTLNQTSKNQIHVLDNSIAKKQKMVEDYLYNNNSKSSFYSNSIMSSLPKTILLTSYSYQPLLKRIKHENPIEINKNIIVISGTSKESNNFSEWIHRLEKTTWIRRVSINSYHNTSTEKSEFEIYIYLKNEKDS